MLDPGAVHGESPREDHSTRELNTEKIMNPTHMNDLLNMDKLGGVSYALYKKYTVRLQSFCYFSFKTDQLCLALV